MIDRNLIGLMNSAWDKRADQLADSGNLCDAYEAGFRDAWDAAKEQPNERIGGGGSHAGNCSGGNLVFTTRGTLNNGGGFERTPIIAREQPKDINDIAGMTCCEKGRIGDGHKCYDEALYKQKSPPHDTGIGKDDVLLPCPFCGVSLKGKPGYMCHEINDCILAAFAWHKSKTAAWNTRATMQTKPPEPLHVPATCKESLQADDVAELRYLSALSHLLSARGNLFVPFDNQKCVNLAKEIAAMPRPMGWMPIESAPKDGTQLFLLIEHENAKYYPEDKWRGRCVGHWIQHNEGGWTWQGIYGKPVKWQPLPLLPATKTEDAFSPAPEGE